MSEYFVRNPKAIFSQDRIPSISYVKTVAIPQLENMFVPSDKTCYYFSSVLSLLRRPGELRNLANTTLLSQCMLVLSFTDSSDTSGQKVTTANTN